MKTIETFMEEVRNSEALQTEFANISDNEMLAAFLKQNGCDASTEEFASYMQSVYAEIADDQTEGEIADEEAEDVQGGMGFINTTGLFTHLFRRRGGTAVNLPNITKKSAGFYSDLVCRRGAGFDDQPEVMLLSESPDAKLTEDGRPRLMSL
ncbi:MAG: hypothetical protein J5851_06035 [Oscillospiraceae bacterium]|nr:hypothetical protein [Oscillospiraceae bacterium]